MHFSSRQIFSRACLSNNCQSILMLLCNFCIIYDNYSFDVRVEEGCAVIKIAQSSGKYFAKIKLEKGFFVGSQLRFWCSFSGNLQYFVFLLMKYFNFFGMYLFVSTKTHLASSTHSRIPNKLVFTEKLRRCLTNLCEPDNSPKNFIYYLFFLWVRRHSTKHSEVDFRC